MQKDALLRLILGTFIVNFFAFLGGGRLLLLRIFFSLFLFT